jgi:hypothetical protein
MEKYNRNRKIALESSAGRINLGRVVTQWRLEQGLSDHTLAFVIPADSRDDY